MVKTKRVWPSLAEVLARPRDVIDDSTTYVRPSPEEDELLRAELAAWRAERAAKKAQVATGADREATPSA
jgi:hypothetical protein